MEIPSPLPIAYLITWTTYGTWLHGDARGSYEKGILGAQPPDPAREEQARRAMVEEEVWLSQEQRDLTEKVIADHCRIRKWTLHAVRARTNHVHVVISGDKDPEDMRDELKAWTSRHLSNLAGLTKRVARHAGRRHWWTERGDVEAIFDHEHLENAVIYVMEKQ
jgi:REP element-mobilizing transposase RayT